MPEDKTTEKGAGLALEVAESRASRFKGCPLIVRGVTPRRGSDSRTDRLYRDHVVAPPGDQA